MRKLALTIVAIHFIIVAAAQVNTGSVLIGGNISYGSQKDDLPGSDMKLIQFSPSIGKAIKTNLIFGIDGTYFHYDQEYPNTMNMSEQIGGGIFLRKYRPLGTTFLLYGQARLGYFHLESENGPLNNPAGRSMSDGNNINFSLMPGIAYRAGKNLILEMGLNNLFKIEFEKTTIYSPVYGGSWAETKKESFFISSSLGSVPLNVGARILIN